MRVQLLGLCVVALACGGVPGAPDDAGPADAGLVDAGLVDAGALDAGAVDAGPAREDAGAAADAGSEVDAGPKGRVVYGFDALHSPLTQDVVTALQQVAAQGPGLREDVFSKVGDSNTVNTNFLQCFAGTHVDLDSHAPLEATRAFFAAAQVGPTTPFDRTSLAATVGWSAGAALAGTPSPLQQELDAAQPRYATVMFGTNDVGSANVDSYGNNLFTLVDTLTAQGVVPLVTSIPRRDDAATADAWVPRYNLVARGVAQARQVPFIDLHQALETVSAHGLGPDGVHLNVYTPGGARGCVLNATGLDYGNNVRNLLTLEALDRARRAVAEGLASDDTAPRRSGSGLPADPIDITALPFVDVRDTRVDGASNVARYDSCSTANEGGPEVLYRLVLDHPAHLRLFVVSRTGADVDLHLLSGPDGVTDCVARNDKVLVQDLAAGTWWLSLDTFVNASGALPGEYLLVVLEE